MSGRKILVDTSIWIDYFKNIYYPILEKKYITWLKKKKYMRRKSILVYRQGEIREKGKY